MSADGTRISYVTSKARELGKYMSTTLDEEWNQTRGMEIQAVGIASVSYDEESQKLAARAAAEVEDPDHVPLRKHLLHGRHGPHQMFEDDGALKDGSRKVRSKIIQILIVRVFQILARLFPVRIVTGSRRLQNHALQKVIRPGQSDQLGHACAPFFLDDGFILITGAFTPRNRKFAVCYSCMHQIAFSTRLRDASPWPTAKDAFSSSLLEPHLTF